MDFKDALAADIDNVFFDTHDFAENAIIDGRSVPVILDDDALNGKSDIYAAGLADGERFIFIREKDMNRLPQPGEQMSFNGRQWYIRHAVSNMGVFGIRIGRERVYD